MSTRLKPSLRKSQILDHALACARKHGYSNVTRKMIADEADISEALVSVYWGTMTQIRRSIMRQAVAVGDAAIVAQGLALRDSYALKAPDTLKAKAAASLSA